MSYEKEKALFEDYLRRNNLKQTEQRIQVLMTFLESERHLTAEELYILVKEKYPSIGYATIFRTLKLLCRAGLCRELKVEDGVNRYEHLYGHEHHDHLICTKCGSFLEVVSEEIETLQEKLAWVNGFVLKSHRMELYGTCKNCRTMG